MSSVVIAGDTSGTVTLQAPAVAGTTVVTLPTVSGGSLLANDSTGTYNLTGSTPRITGDFTNSTISSRVCFQSNTTNASTIVTAIPTGTQTISAFSAETDPAATNMQFMQINSNTYNSGTPGLIAGARGTATVPPMTFWTNSTKQAEISVTGIFSFNSGYGSSAPAYGCRAWVNFNGTGTVAIRASGNVSSITDNGTGDYTVNFNTAMPDVNYCAQISATGAVSTYHCVPFFGTPGSNDTTGFPNTSSFRYSQYNVTNSSARADPVVSCVAIFR